MLAGSELETYEMQSEEKRDDTRQLADVAAAPKLAVGGERTSGGIMSLLADKISTLEMLVPSLLSAEQYTEQLKKLVQRDPLLAPLLRSWAIVDVEGLDPNVFAAHATKTARGDAVSKLPLRMRTTNTSFG